MLLPQFDSDPGRQLYLEAFDDLSNKRVAVRSIDEIENAAYSSSFPGRNVTPSQLLHASIKKRLARSALAKTSHVPIDLLRQQRNYQNGPASCLIDAGLGAVRFS